MNDQHEKCMALAQLHEEENAWIIPNPWDLGSALDLQKLGFKALATSSAACAYTLGLKDGEVTLDEKLMYCSAMASKTTVPISVDFEDGYSNEATSVAINVQRLAETGVAGCSIEDYSRTDQKTFDFNHAVERVQAAAEAASSMNMPFQLIARADGLLRQHADLEDAIRRLQAFSAAGAHVLYAPGLGTLEDIELVADSTDRPLNVLSPFLPGKSLQALSEAGATRVSLGNVLLEKARTHFVTGMKEMLSTGSAS